ncbi:MAG: aminotransferase class V-fold PLP-dependent enzyme [Gemmatimonadales bacterium]
MTLSRRTFTRLAAVAGVPWLGSAFRSERDFLSAQQPLPRAPAEPDEAYWAEVRRRMVLPADLAFMNAANLCPASTQGAQALIDASHQLDADPSPIVRNKLAERREMSRQAIADFLSVGADEILMTRNTSESNNLVSSGLSLSRGDEVVVLSDNHPSNEAAWRAKAARFGFTVVSVPVLNPHPGDAHYLEAVAAALTPRTRVLAFTHVTNTVGDRFPAEGLCRLARERNVLSMVDGAQTVGLLNLDLSRIRPDFYSASIHKWLCGPKETGILYVNRAVHDRIAPSIVSLYGGKVGISRTLEAMGQRDEAALATLDRAVAFHREIGMTAIERRALGLADRLRQQLAELPGVELWTSRDPARSAAVVALRPGKLDPQKLAAALYQQDRIVVATRGGTDRPGIRFSPHFYNSPAEVDRAVQAVRTYLAKGV